MQAERRQKSHDSQAFPPAVLLTSEPLAKCLCVTRVLRLAQQVARSYGSFVGTVCIVAQVHRQCLYMYLSLKELFVDCLSKLTRIDI